MAEHHLDTEEWGTGQKSVIWVTVQDTGCGLTPAEQGNLFTRFTQATPRTHVQYGGSGLGLFISKSLTELQNGRIGVCSEANVGSTFAFFVGTRIASPLQEDFAVESAHLGVERLISVAESVKAAHISVLIVEDNLVNVSAPTSFSDIHFVAEFYVNSKTSSPGNSKKQAAKCT